jgi:hypothetical protein
LLVIAPENALFFMPFCSDKWAAKKRRKLGEFGSLVLAAAFRVGEVAPQKGGPSSLGRCSRLISGWGLCFLRLFSPWQGAFATFSKNRRKKKTQLAGRVHGFKYLGRRD